MKETIRNLKKIYSYGIEYKSCLIIQILCCIVGIIMNITIPLISAKFIVNFTDLIWNQVLFMAIILLIIDIFAEFKTLIIRKNTQEFRRGTIRNIQIKII